MALFTKSLDATKTQLAYKLNYWPHSMLGNKAKELLYTPPQAANQANRPLVMTKGMILSKLVDDADTRFLVHQGVVYKIHWLFNCVPTETEWDRKSNDYMLRVEFRFLKFPRTLPIVLLSFDNVRTHIAREEDMKQVAESYTPGQES
jgi:hypothetical protein